MPRSYYNSLRILPVQENAAGQFAYSTKLQPAGSGVEQALEVATPEPVAGRNAILALSPDENGVLRDNQSILPSPYMGMLQNLDANNGNIVIDGNRGTWERKGVGIFSISYDSSPGTQRREDVQLHENGVNITETYTDDNKPNRSVEVVRKYDNQFTLAQRTVVQTSTGNNADAYFDHGRPSTITTHSGFSVDNETASTDTNLEFDDKGRVTQVVRDISHSTDLSSTETHIKSDIYNGTTVSAKARIFDLPTETYVGDELYMGRVRTQSQSSLERSWDIHQKPNGYHSYMEFQYTDYNSGQIFLSTTSDITRTFGPDGGLVSANGTTTMQRVDGSHLEGETNQTLRSDGNYNYSYNSVTRSANDDFIGSRDIKLVVAKDPPIGSSEFANAPDNLYEMPDLHFFNEQRFANESFTRLSGEFRLVQINPDNISRTAKDYSWSDGGWADSDGEAPNIDSLQQFTPRLSYFPVDDINMKLNFPNPELRAPRYSPPIPQTPPQPVPVPDTSAPSGDSASPSARIAIPAQNAVAAKEAGGNKIQAPRMGF